MIHERTALARLPKFAARGGLMTSCAALLVLGLGVGAQSKPVVTSFDPAGSAGTQAVGINAGGVIAGYYSDSSGTHGFVRAADGTIKSFDPAGSTVTHAAGINTKGEIVGTYTDPNTGNQWGYVRAVNGKFHTFQDNANASPTCINDSGTTAGWFGGTDTFIHGFVRSAGGGFTPFDIPGEGSTFGTYPSAINKAGTVAGIWLDGNQAAHGFYRTASGAITTFDPPNSLSTAVAGIDAAGAITGYFTDANGEYGYVRAVGGTYSVFNPTGSLGTTASGINTKGVVAGTYATDSESNSAAFVRAPGGKITSFSAEGSGYTSAYAINVLGAITGSYYGADDLVHGFVRTP